MKIEVAKRDLEAALQVVSIGASSTGNDLTTHYVFRVKNGVGEVLSNNGRLGASSPFIASVKGEGSFTVESWRLNKWISAVQDAVLTLEDKDNTIVATAPKGSVKFQSLDASVFPYWDEQFSETKKGIRVKAKRFQAALSHVKMFISDKEQEPKLMVTEVLGDCLQSTDKSALAVVTLRHSKIVTDPETGEVTTVYEPELKGSNLRIHGKDLGPVLSFLGTCGDEAVEIREHDRCLFLVREDGSVLNVGRPRQPFPELGVSEQEGKDPHWWTVKTADLKSGVLSLVASAAREDRRMAFNLEDGLVTMEMASSSGAKNVLRLETTDFGSGEGVVPMPETGFEIPYPHILSVLSQYKGDTITLGLNPQVDPKGKMRGGWTRFRDLRGDDDYLTLLVWKM